MFCDWKYVLNCIWSSILIWIAILHRLQTPREEIVFTARPKIQSQSQIVRYSRSIFCLPHWPNFSDIFDWVSVVRDSSWKIDQDPKRHIHCFKDWSSKNVSFFFETNTLERISFNASIQVFITVAICFEPQSYFLCLSVLLKWGHPKQQWVVGFGWLTG